MTTVRELAPQAELLRRFDGHVVWVTPETWHCPMCTQPGGEGAASTVEWLSSRLVNGPDGRCRECGLKFVLAPPGARIPTVEEQLRLRGVKGLIHG